jgi:hypothetical protein
MKVIGVRLEVTLCEGAISHASGAGNLRDCRHRSHFPLDNILTFTKARTGQKYFCPV